MQYMNRKFQQEGTTSYLNYRLYKEELEEIPKDSKDDLEVWFD